MSENYFVALAGVIGAIGGSVVTGAVTILNTIHKNQRENRAVRFNEQSAIIDRQEKQIARLEGQISVLQEEHGRCREDAAELRVCLTLLHDYAKRQYAAMAAAGINSDPPPDLPSGFETRGRQETSPDLSAASPAK